MRDSLPEGWVRSAGPNHVLVACSEIAKPLQELGLDSPGSALAHASETGASGRARTRVLELEGVQGKILVRAVRRGGLLGNLLGGSLLGLARPLSEIQVTQALHSAAAPVPRPAFVQGWRRGGPVWNAAVGTFLEPHACDALEWLARAPDSEKLRQAARAAGSAVRRFHDCGGVHADLHIKNLLVRELADSTEVVIVDLDKAKRRASVSDSRRMQELMRLYRSLKKRRLLKSLGNEVVESFFRAYLGGDAAMRTRLERYLTREQLRIALHSLTWRGPR